MTLNDRDLKSLFDQLRREHREVPPFRNLRWVREEPETRRTLVRRLTVAAIAAAVVSPLLAAWVVAWRMAESEVPLVEESRVVVKRYVPPPPQAEFREVKKFSPPKAVSSEASYLVGAPEREAPPSSGPLLAGAEGITPPVPIVESYTTPAHERSVPAETAAAVMQAGYHPTIGPGALREIRRTVILDPDSGGFIAEIIDPSDELIGGTETYATIEDNSFHLVADAPLSTFSADVDTASYASVRRFLSHGRRPPRDAVRVEELINYFDYARPAALGDDPLGVDVEVADCPWDPRHRLARITLAGRQEPRGGFSGSNLVFLLDVSGSMRHGDKLPLLKRAMSMLVEQLDQRDTVSIVVYAGASGLVLPPTPGSDRATILDALGRLEAGGSTAGAAGLRLAYRIARENFTEGGVNRVILATDGDFNVGVSGHAELLQIIEDDARRGVFLTTLGVGSGNYKDDRLEQLSNRGNGNHAYLDSLAEARKVLVEEIGATLVTVAKDVKLQVEFNPVEVGGYRLVGYENRLLAHRDFNDDRKDAGEIGSGHTVTVLYELVPPGETGVIPEVDPLRYQTASEPSAAAGDGELFRVNIRFKRPTEQVSVLRTYPVRDDGRTLETASDDFRFAAAVAAFGMRLRRSVLVRDFDWNAIESLAAGAVGVDEHGHRARFLEQVGQAAAGPER